MPYKDKHKQSAFCAEWIKRRRQEWLAEHGPCECGSMTGLEMHWSGDGRRPSTGHRVFSYRKEKREVMLSGYVAKCSACRLAFYQIPHSTLVEVISLLRAGYGARAVSKLVGIDRETVQKYYQRLREPLPDCICGKPSGHHGRCWWRLGLDELFNPRVDDLRQLRRAKASISSIQKYIKENLTDAR
jgi:hypothetical protein